MSLPSDSSLSSSSSSRRAPSIFTVLVAASLGLAAARPAQAATYYLDSVAGNDSANGTTEATAWKTVVPLDAKVLQAGDTVRFKKGSTFDVGVTGANTGFTLPPAQSGTAEQPITFTTYGVGARPIFLNSRTGSIYIDDFYVRASYVVFDGLELTGAQEAGISIEGTHVTVQNCDFHGVGIAVIAFGDDALITRNTMHDLIMVKNTEGGDDDYGANGVVVAASRVEISYNRADRLVAPSFDYGVDGGFVELYGTMTDVTVHHNVVHDSEGFVESGGPSGSEITDVTIAFNVSVGNRGFLTMHNGGDGFSATYTNVVVANNTIVETTGEPSPVFWTSAAAVPGAFRVTNNVVRATTSGKLYQRAGIAHDHNLYDLGAATQLGVTADATELIAAAGFVDEAGGDYHLMADSPAIDQGGATAVYATDLDGHAVPSGAGVDLGAYEYVVPGSDVDAAPGTADAGASADDGGLADLDGGAIDGDAGADDAGGAGADGGAAGGDDAVGGGCGCGVGGARGSSGLAGGLLVLGAGLILGARRRRRGAPRARA